MVKMFSVVILPAQLPKRNLGESGIFRTATDRGEQVMRGITNVDTRQVALPLLWLSGSAISPARLFK